MSSQQRCSLARVPPRAETMAVRTENRRNEPSTETLNIQALPQPPPLFVGLPGQLPAPGYAPFGYAPGFAPYPPPIGGIAPLPWPQGIAYPGIPQGWAPWTPQPFQGFAPATLQSLPPLGPPQGAPNPTPGSIPVALQDLGREVVATFEVPGIAASDLNVVVGNTTVTVRTLRPAANGRVYQGTFALPAEVLPSQASARLEHGLLVLTLPRRTPTEEPRRVEVEN